ncbi:MAG: alpha/beta fold hydrolase [Gemmatimonadaceae bacterium]|nr:alpha/beta fold hydrolase [Gemmatimonadaceae bacterium]
MPDTEDQRPVIPADWPNADCSMFIHAAGLRWHVQRAGRGPVALLVHGTAGASHTWRDVLPRLTPRADVLAVDLPGHGFTTGATPDQLSLHGMTAALADLLRTLGVAPVIAAGHSAGAAVLLQLASSREVAPRSIIGVNSALVSLNPLGQLFLPFSRALADLAPLRSVVGAVMESGTIARALLRSTGSTLDPAQEARYVALLTSGERVTAALRMMARWDLPALVATFPSIVQPVTLIHSRNEPWVPWDDLMASTRTLPDRTVVDVTPAGHLIPDEQPARVAAVITAALDALAARPG